MASVVLNALMRLSTKVGMAPFTTNTDIRPETDLGSTSRRRAPFVKAGSRVPEREHYDLKNEKVLNAKRSMRFY